jgi:hypothetical protein
LKLKIRQYEISIATPEDSDRILQLAKELYHKTPYNNNTFNYNSVKAFIDKVLLGDKDENIFLCLWRDGKIIGCLGASIIIPFWSNEKVATEFFLYSTSGMLLLLDAYESWARSKGCDSMQIGIDHSKRRFFRGYLATEQMYIKRLK